MNILPDILRGSTTTICLLILLPVLSKTVLKTKQHILVTSIITVFDLLICTFFYLNKNYTGVLYYSLTAYLIIILGFKLLYKDKLLQWLFNCVTVLNVYAIIVIGSYFLADLFPDPEYAVTLIRIALFILTILFFKKIIRPLYLEVSENWAAFLLPTTGILINYLYILMSLSDIETSMNENINYFYILTLITVLSYAAIIISLKSLRVKFQLREENIKRKANEDLLKSEIDSYESIVVSAKQTRHDIRHHNSILREFLNTNDIEGAKDYLKLYDDHLKDNVIKDFSKNPTANAVFRIYERRARNANIDFIVHSEADVMLSNRLPDIGIVLSNILENALTACMKCDFTTKHIYYTSIIQNDSILLEFRNSVKDYVQFENGLPITTKVGGGTGLVSVKTIIEKSNGMLNFKQNNHEFFTHIILPIL